MTTTDHRVPELFADTTQSENGVQTENGVQAGGSTSSTFSSESTTDVALHVEIEAMLASQMHLLDDGHGADWAQTFTADGVFEANAHPEPVRGRAAIGTAAQSVADQLAARGVTRRHWLGMLSVRRTGPRTAVARSYAIVLMTPLGGQAAINCSTSCEDELVQQDGRWLVSHRRVRRDDLA